MEQKLFGRRLPDSSCDSSYGLREVITVYSGTKCSSWINSREVKGQIVQTIEGGRSDDDDDGG